MNGKNGNGNGSSHNGKALETFSDLRKDIFGRRVVLTSSRGSRPHDFTPPERKPKSGDSSKCFFCPGNEHMTPPELDRVEKDGKWKVRCFPNKFPAFFESSKKAYGRHEVIVESPEHEKELSELSEGHIFDYLALLQRRMKEAMKDPRLKYTVIFKNEGPAAGASLEHSHTQLVSMEFVPSLIAKMAKKTAAFCKLERQNKKRTFLQTPHYFAFCPKASRFKHEFWIMPRFQVATLIDLSEPQLRGLASIMKSSLSALDESSGYGPYNIVFHSAPHGESKFPFHIEVLPRLSTWAGFELATEVVMVSTRPHETAGLLRYFIEKKQ